MRPEVAVCILLIIGILVGGAIAQTIYQAKSTIAPPTLAPPAPPVPGTSQVASATVVYTETASGQTFTWNRIDGFTPSAVSGFSANQSGLTDYSVTVSNSSTSTVAIRGFWYTSLNHNSALAQYSSQFPVTGANWENHLAMWTEVSGGIQPGGQQVFSLSSNMLPGIVAARVCSNDSTTDITWMLQLQSLPVSLNFMTYVQMDISSYTNKQVWIVGPKYPPTNSVQNAYNDMATWAAGAQWAWLQTIVALPQTKQLGALQSKAASLDGLQKTFADAYIYTLQHLPT